MKSQIEEKKNWNKNTTPRENPTQQIRNEIRCKSLCSFLLQIYIYSKQNLSTFKSKSIFFFAHLSKSCLGIL